MLGTILLILIILMLVGALPTWPHSRNWGYYDLPITDNNMPKLSGVELVKKVRSERMALPVIMASGARPAEELGLQLAAMLLKPFTGEELLGTVKRVLRAADMPHGRRGVAKSAKPAMCG